MCDIDIVVCGVCHGLVLLMWLYVLLNVLLLVCGCCDKYIVCLLNDVVHMICVLLI